MTDDELDALLKAARADTCDTSRVEHAFETRLMARIRAESDQTLRLGRWAWRLAPIFAGVTIACASWSFPSMNVILPAAVVSMEEDWLIVEVMTGKHI